MLCLLPNRGLVGSQGLKHTMKKNTPNVDARARILFQMKISDLSAPTNPKQGSFFFKFYLQAALCKFNLQISTLELQSHTFLRQIVQFQLLIMNGWLNCIYRIFCLPNTEELSVVFEYSGFKRATFFAQTIWAFFGTLVSKTQYISFESHLRVTRRNFGLRFKQKFLTVSKIIGWKSG